MKEFERRSIVNILILSIITLGLYIPLWLLRYREAFNGLNSERKLTRGPLIISFFIILLEVPYILVSFFYWIVPIDPMLDFGLQTFYLLGYIIILVYSFKARNILIEHYGVEISPILTFFFSIFYLQYKINQVLDLEPVERAPESLEELS